MMPDWLRNFLRYLWDKRNEVLLSILGFFLATAIGGTALNLVQEGLKKLVYSDRTTADLKMIDSAHAVFPAQSSLEVIQLLTYELSASDFLKNIRITATFGKTTEIVRHHVFYSIDVEGYEAAKAQTNQITISLKHHLDVKRKARIYLLTKKNVDSRENAQLEHPDIHVEGQDKDGKTVYR